jgi:hypothetical protein
MDAIALTKSLVRKDVKVSLIDKAANNPNKMGSVEFNLLVDNLSKTGITDPILVRSNPKKPGRFTVVGGHHRLDGAQFLGFEEVPCTIITDPAFDEEAATFQMVRMNMIRGRMDPEKFFKLYEEMASKYSDQILQDAFGFADEAEFRKMVEQAAKSLPDPQMQKAFKEAAKEVKTIDGLATLLNQMFTKYGDSMPYGFMVFDYGSQRNVWVQTSLKTMQAFDLIGELCREQSRTIDDLVGGLLQMIAKGELAEQLQVLIDKSPEVAIPKYLQTIPTKQNLHEAGKVTA